MSESDFGFIKSELSKLCGQHKEQSERLDRISNGVRDIKNILELEQKTFDNMASTLNNIQREQFKKQDMEDLFERLDNRRELKSRDHWEKVEKNLTDKAGKTATEIVRSIRSGQGEYAVSNGSWIKKNIISLIMAIIVFTTLIGGIVSGYFSSSNDLMASVQRRISRVKTEFTNTTNNNMKEIRVYLEKLDSKKR